MLCFFLCFDSDYVNPNFNRYYNNAYYAKVGGICTKEMNLLELDFLFGLGFDLNVKPNTFQAYFSYLQNEMTLLHQPLSLVHVPIPSSRSVITFNDDEVSHQKQQLTV